MKKLSIALLSFLFVGLASITAAQAQESDTTVFTQGTLEELVKLAVDQDKYVFIDFYADWCAPCKHMSTNIFPDAEVAEYMNKHFIVAKLNAEEGYGAELAKASYIRSYPTCIIYNQLGVESTRMTGAERTPESFLERIGRTFYDVSGRK